MAQIFLSYSRRDQDFVNNLISRIEAQGHSVWVDRASLRSGGHWQSQIVNAIEGADVFLVALSQNSIGSDHVLTELNLAKDSRLPIIPIVIESLAIPGSMKYQLAGLQLSDLSRDFNAGLRGLLSVLEQYKQTPQLGGSKYNVRFISDWLKRIQQDGGNANWVIFDPYSQGNIFIQVDGYINNPTLRAQAAFINNASASQIATLKALGWEVWDVAYPENYSRNFEARTDSERMSIAQFFMRTLVEVYGIHPEAQLHVEFQLDWVAPGVARLVPNNQP